MCRCGRLNCWPPGSSTDPKSARQLLHILGEEVSLEVHALPDLGGNQVGGRNGVGRDPKHRRVVVEFGDGEGDAIDREGTLGDAIATDAGGKGDFVAAVLTLG